MSKEAVFWLFTKGFGKDLLMNGLRVVFEQLCGPDRLFFFQSCSKCFEMAPDLNSS